MESLLLVASFVCSTLMFYFSLIHSLPKVFMHFILKFMSKQNTRWNVVEHLTKRTHEHRNIVLPCPDLLYSTVACDFSSDPTTVLLFSAPANDYSSLGLYDDSARCVEIVSHSDSPLRVAVVGPEVTCSDADIMSSLLGFGDGNEKGEKEGMNCTVVRRMPTAKGLLLHRLLMVDPSAWAEMQALQASTITCSVHTLDAPSQGQSESGSHNSRQSSHILRLLWSVARKVRSIVHIPTALPCLCLLLGLLLKHRTMADVVADSGSVWMYAAGVLTAGLLVSAAAVFVTLKQLKKPRVVHWTKLMTLEKIGDWSFNALDTTTSTSSAGGELVAPFAHLIFFLHGALGLLPSEVYYGAATAAHCDEEKEEGEIEAPMTPLRHGESYVITLPPYLDLRCAWWSLTVYDSDLFLVPNEAGIYSVNSFQLKAAAAVARETQRDQQALRIVCSPVRPEVLAEDEVAWLPMPPQPVGGHDHHHPPRFVLRGW